MNFTERVSQNNIFASFEGPFISALLGSRRVGKSFLVSTFIESHPDRLWVKLNMDATEQRREIELKGLAYVIETQALCAIGKGPKLWVAIDEAQKYPPLFEAIKIIYDSYKDQEAIKFILTGSGYLELHQLTAESLAGRIELFYLNEFSLREHYDLQKKTSLLTLPILSLLDEDKCDQLEKNITALSPLSKQLAALLEQQLLWGGLPEVLLATTTPSRLQYLANYLQTYLEKDVRNISGISDLHLYRNLLDIVAEQTGSVRQDKAIMDALGCARDTLKKYRGYLQATLVYQDIYPYIGRSLRRLVKAPKGYLMNNGLISYLTGLHEINILQKTGLIGHRFENWFLKELQVWLAQKPQRNEIYYWRTTSGAEVDFIVARPPYLFAFEITYSKQIMSKKLNNLVAFMAEHPKTTAGFYIYMGDFAYDAKNNIYFIPAWCIG